MRNCICFKRELCVSTDAQTLETSNTQTLEFGCVSCSSCFKLLRSIIEITSKGIQTNAIHYDGFRSFHFMVALFP